MKTMKCLLFVWVIFPVLASGNVFAQEGIGSDWWPSVDPSDIIDPIPTDPVFYTITATCENNGTIKPTGTVSVKKGETRAFTIQTDEGYKVKDVTADGKSVFAEMIGNTYTFTDVSTDHTIHVTFEDGYRYHSVDCGAGNHPEDAGDYKISLSELLRVQQLYNHESYHCDAEGEDGYALRDGDRACPPHDSDYNPQNWKIDLGELLRVIQFYNVGGYRADGSGEDGFATLSE